MLPQQSAGGGFEQGGGPLQQGGPQLPPHLAMNEKQLTAAIKNATTAERLAQLADVHSAKLNPIHVAAILTKMANISKKASTQSITQLQRQAATADKPAVLYAMKTLQTRQVLAEQLMEKLKAQRCQGHCPRGLANIVWAVAKLQCNPDLDLVKMLLQNFCNQLPVAVPQDIANILWGVAQLTRDYGSAAGSTVEASSAMPKDSSSAPHDSAEMQGSAAAAAAAAAAAVADTEESGLCDLAATAAENLAAGSEPSSSIEPAGDAAGGPITTTPSSNILQDTSSSSRTDDSMGAAASAAAELQEDSAPDTTAADPSSDTDNSCAKALCKHLPLLTVVQVQLLLRQLCTMLPLAASQTISNIAWAIAVLQYNHEWCMCGCLPQMRQLTVAFASKLGDALPGHVQRVVRCLAQVSAACSNHAGLAWVEWQPPALNAMMQHLVAQRKQMKQCHVAMVLKDVAQVAYLYLPADVAAQLDRDAAEAAAKAAAAAEAAVQAQQQLQQANCVGRILGQAGALAPAAVAPAAAAAAPAEPRSPISQFTHELVSAMFEKLLLQDAGSSSGTAAAAPVQPASDAAAMAELVQKEVYSDDEELGSEEGGEAGGIRSSSSSILPAWMGQRLGPTARAAARSAAAAAIMQVVIPQLDSLGILHPYNALRSLYTHHNAAMAWLFKPEAGYTTKQEGIPDYKDMSSGPQPAVVPYHLQLKQYQQQQLSQQQGLPQIAVPYGAPPPPPHYYAGYMPPGFYPAGMVPAAVPYGYYPAAAMYGAHSGASPRGGHIGGQMPYGVPPSRQAPPLHPGSVPPPPPPPPASDSHHSGSTYAARQQQQQVQPAPHREDQGNSSKTSSGTGAAASGGLGKVKTAAAAAAAATAAGEASQSDPSQSYEQSSPFESALSSAADAIGPGGTVSSGPSNITASGSSGARSSLISMTSSMNSVLSMQRYNRSAGTNASGSSAKCTSTESMPHGLAYQAASQADRPTDLYTYSAELQQQASGVPQHRSIDAARSSQDHQQQIGATGSTGGTSGGVHAGHTGSSAAAAVKMLIHAGPPSGSTIGSTTAGNTSGGTAGDFLEGSSHTGSAMFMHAPPHMAGSTGGTTGSTIDAHGVGGVLPEGKAGAASCSMQQYKQYMPSGSGPGSTGSSAAAAATGVLPSDPGPSAKLLMQQQQQQQQQSYQVMGAPDDTESGKVVYLQVNGQYKPYREMPDGSLVPVQQQQQKQQQHPQQQQQMASQQRHSVTGSAQQHSASLLHQQHSHPHQQQQHVLLVSQSSAPAAYSVPLQQQQSYQQQQQQQWQLGSVGSESYGLMQQQQLPTTSQYITSALSGSVAAVNTGIQASASSSAGLATAGAAVYQEPATGAAYTIQQQQQLLDDTGGCSSYAAFAAPGSGGPGTAVNLAAAGGGGGTQVMLPGVAVGMQGNMGPVPASGMPVAMQHRNSSGVDAAGLVGSSVGAPGSAAGSGYVYLPGSGTMQPAAFATVMGQQQQQLQGSYVSASEQFGGGIAQQQYMPPGIQSVPCMSIQQAAMQGPGLSMTAMSNMGMATAAASQSYIGGASGPGSHHGTLQTLLLDPSAIQQQQQQQQQLLDFQQQQLLLQPTLMAPQQQQQQQHAVYYITPPGF